MPYDRLGVAVVPLAGAEVETELLVRAEVVAPEPPGTVAVLRPEVKVTPF
jgi:hypothetical protein